MTRRYAMEDSVQVVTLVQGEIAQAIANTAVAIIAENANRITA